RPPIADTQHPAAALYHAAYQQHDIGTFVLVDVSGHLKDEKTLRILREAIDRIGNRGGQIVLLDAGELPRVIRAVGTEFHVSFPDEKELETILRETLRHLNEELRIVVDLSRADLQVIVRNLRGV